MYYECHITLPQAYSSAIAPIAEQHKFKTSEIARDPVLGNDTYFYCTCHNSKFDEIYDRMRNLSADLTAAGIPIIREKIEHIVYDSKRGSY